jgi:NitT/TauT family transport system substrate-binding protein
MMLRSIVLTIGFALLAFGAGGAQGLTTLKIGILPNDDMMALIYAQKTGMFAKAGLDVSFDRSSANGAAIAAAVLGGSFDFGKSSPPALIDAHLRDVPFVVVATGGIYESKTPYAALIVAKNSPVRSPKDLENAVVGISVLHGLGQLSLLKIYDEAGLSMKNMRIVEVPMTASAAAVDAGRVAAAELTYPPLQAALETGKFRLVPLYDTLASTFAISLWFTTKDFSAKHPEVVRTFVRVVYEAARYTNTHHDVTAPILAEFTGIPLDVIKKMPRVTNGTGMSVSLIQPIIDAEAKYGYIAHGFAAREMIDPGVDVR